MQNRKSFAHLCRLALPALLLLFLFFPATVAQKIPFNNFTIQNGLPQNSVNDIDQDRNGYIWFATQVGLARYDGFEFEYFQSADGLADNFVNCMLMAEDGRIWFGTEGGLSVFDGELFSSFYESDGLVSNYVDKLLEDKDGNIWVGTAYGLSILTEDSIVTYSKGKIITDNSIVDMFLDSRGRVHVSTYTLPGLTVFDNPFISHCDTIEEIIWDIAEDRDGNIYYATQGVGIQVNSGIGAKMLGRDQGLTDETVLSLLVDTNGDLWCGTYLQGLFRFSDGRFTRVSLNPGYEPAVLDLLEDRKGRLWARSFGEGLYSLDEGKSQYFDMENSLVNDAVNELFEDSFGNIWIATQGGASMYGKALFEIYDMETGLPNNLVQALLLDSRDRLWLGTEAYLAYRKRGKEYALSGELKGFPESANPLSFAEDQNGGMYVGSSEGLYYFNGRSVQPVVYNGENAIRFPSLYYSEEKELWCATDSGVFILSGGNLRVPPGQSLFKSVYATDIVRLGDYMYCATEGGVSVLDQEGKHVRNYSMDNGLPSEVCVDLEVDYQGKIWIATDKGLGCLDPASETIDEITLDKAASGTCYFVAFSDSVSLLIGTERGLHRLDIESGENRLYGYEEGFRPLETSARAVTGDGDGGLWIGTVAGMVHYDSRYDQHDPVPPILDLQMVTAGGEPLTEIKGTGVAPILPYKRNSLVFEFTGIHTTIPSENRFSFMLEGLDEDWSVPGTDRSASYWKIPSGDYRFLFKAYNPDGLASEAYSFPFSVKPPFWNTIWFIILEIFTGFMLVYGFVQFRERQLIREKRVLEKRVKIRTREIEEQKLEIENQRDEIAGANKEITDSILYARRIQTAVLPGKVLLKKYLPEHFVMLKPRDIVSGDFYWVEEKNDRVIACAADCTGHGVPGAFMSLLGLTFLNEIVNRDGILKAGEILDRLRTYIIRAMSHKDGQAKDGMDMALVVIDRKLKTLEFAGAYNPLVLIRRGELIEYKGDKMPVGKHVVEERPFVNHRINLEDGDLLYMFSDGFPDQFGGERGGKFKSRPFRRLLEEISGEDMEMQEELLRKELDNWMREEEQVDDILVMGLRFRTGY